MPFGNRLMAHLVNRLLGVLVRFAEVLDRAIEVVNHQPDRVRLRDRTATLVTQRDPVVVQAGVALRPRVRQEAEAEAGAVARRRRVLRVTEVEMASLAHRTHRLEVVRAVVVADRVVVLLVVRLSLRDRQGHPMTLRMFRMESVSWSLRTHVVR